MISIRRAKDSDIDSIYEIEKESFGNFYPKDYIQYLLNENHIFFLAYDGHTPVGYLAAKTMPDSIVYVVSLAVRPAYRKKKIAKQILSFVHDYFTKENMEYFVLEVKDTNKPAINLYKSLGYEIFDFQPNYYPDESNAYFMRKVK